MNPIRPILLAALVTTSCSTSKLGKPVNHFAVDEVFATVQTQLLAAEETLANDTVLTSRGYKFKPTDADLVLDNVVSIDGSASLTILVFKPSYTYTRKKETTITFSLSNKDTSLKAHAIFGLGGNKLHFKRNPNALRDLIVQTAEQMARLKFTFGQGNIPAPGKDCEIDIVFTLENDGGLDISGPLSAILNGDISATIDQANAHTITLKFHLL